jgi:hypothetical protein
MTQNNQPVSSAGVNRGAGTNVPLTPEQSRFAAVLGDLLAEQWSREEERRRQISRPAAGSEVEAPGSKT